MCSSLSPDAIPVAGTWDPGRLERNRIRAAYPSAGAARRHLRLRVGGLTPRLRLQRGAALRAPRIALGPVRAAVRARELPAALRALPRLRRARRRCAANLPRLPRVPIEEKDQEQAQEEEPEFDEVVIDEEREVGPVAGDERPPRGLGDHDEVSRLRGRRVRGHHEERELVNVRVQGARVDVVVDAAGIVGNGSKDWYVRYGI